jgi:four helix bundle protein
MAKIERFEEIIAWQKGMELCDAVYTITLQENFAKDYALKDQIRKSAISIPSNISEGFERESNNQFIYFLVIAKASAGELRTQLYIAKNQKYISEEEFQKLKEQCLNVSKLISGFISYLRKKRKEKELSKLS